jgi:hypothetical protein
MHMLQARLGLNIHMGLVFCKNSLKLIYHQCVASPGMEEMQVPSSWVVYGMGILTTKQLS